MGDPPVICLGETLWDVLPTGEFLGGAPLNVAIHLARLGVPAALVSRVGNDKRGDLALERIRALGLATDTIQVDPQLPTGDARAALDEQGSAQYVFGAPAAWDRIEDDANATQAAARAPAVVFGTLAQRSPASRDAIRRLVDTARLRILDVNLRAPHDDRDVVLDSLARADLVKLNEDELRRLTGWLDTRPDAESLRQALAARFATKSLCITLGPAGALLWHQGAWIEQPPVPTTIGDTIGAGDAFLAMLLAGLLCGTTARVALSRAAHLASFVASQHGALPAYDPAQFLT